MLCLQMVLAPGHSLYFRLTQIVHGLQVGGVTGYVTTPRQTTADLDKLFKDVEFELLFYLRAYMLFNITGCDVWM